MRATRFIAVLALLVGGCEADFGASRSGTDTAKATDVVSAAVDAIGDPGPCSTCSDGASRAEDSDASAVLLPFGAPCDDGAACAGDLAECVETGEGPLCSHQCATDADCEDEWRCVYCSPDCPAGSHWFHCIPAIDAADIVACDPQTGAGSLALDGLLATGDHESIGVACQLTITDVDARRLLVDCPGTGLSPQTLELNGTAATLPAPLLAEPAVRMTWVALGTEIPGMPVYFILRDALQNRLLLAHVIGVTHTPNPATRAPIPWEQGDALYAPLAFEMLETSCPLEFGECGTWQARALRVTLDGASETLQPGGLAELGASPRYQVYLEGASRALPDGMGCSDSGDVGLSLTVLRLAD